MASALPTTTLSTKGGSPTALEASTPASPVPRLVSSTAISSCRAAIIGTLGLASGCSRAKGSSRSERSRQASSTALPLRSVLGAISG